MSECPKLEDAEIEKQSKYPAVHGWKMTYPAWTKKSVAARDAWLAGILRCNRSSISSCEEMDALTKSIDMKECPCSSCTVWRVLRGEKT